MVHEQKFKDLLSSTCQVSVERRVLNLESEAMRGLGYISTWVTFCYQIICFHVVKPLMPILSICEKLDWRRVLCVNLVKWDFAPCKRSCGKVMLLQRLSVHIGNINELWDRSHCRGISILLPLPPWTTDLLTNSPRHLMSPLRPA